MMKKSIILICLIVICSCKVKESENPSPYTFADTKLNCYIDVESDYKDITMFNFLSSDTVRCIANIDIFLEYRDSTEYTIEKELNSVVLLSQDRTIFMKHETDSNMIDIFNKFNDLLYSVICSINCEVNNTYHSEDSFIHESFSFSFLLYP